MPKVSLVPIFDDNYVPVLIDEDRKEALVVDPGDAAPVSDFLTKHSLKPLALLLTHHHADHIGGARALQEKFQIPSYAPSKEKTAIPFASFYVQEGDVINRGPFRLHVWELPGHTRGHIAYWEKNQKWLFSGDVIFSLGCGRIFDGTMMQQYQSLNRLKTLPPETLIYCAHEYTEKNLLFSLQKDPGNPGLLEFAKEVQNRRQQGLPTVPFTLDQELRLNPFLKASSAAEFQLLREARTHF